MRQNHTSHFAWTTVVAGLASWLLALGLVACQSTSDPVESRAVEGEPVENLYGLTPEIVGEVPERTWTEPPVRRIAQLPGRSNQPLYIPVMARIKRDGRIYVWDAGDSAYLKAFTPEGEFVQGYGRGQGQGPGQVGGALMDFGVRGDSIYVVDGRYRRIHVFGKDGGYGRTDVHQRSIHRLDYSRDSTTCISRVGPQSSTLLEMRAPGKRPQAVPYPVDRDIPLMHLVISMDRKAFAHQDRCIYVPKYYPVILTYSHGDTVGRAHPTPTYGEVSMPEARTEENGVVRPPSLPITNAN